jgi:hypothetical protein
MQITHEEAHSLIQFDADAALNAQEKNRLAAHLQECTECRSYAVEIKMLEDLLVPEMKRRWNLQPAPLLIDALRANRHPKLSTSNLLATRTAAVGIVVFAFIFSVWQFTLSGQPEPTRLPVSVLPIPTPSTQATGTNTILQNCEGMLYIVQENDTLESVASQFSVSKEELMAANQMKTETLYQVTKLMIPICGFTPTGTLTAMTLTKTDTPSIRPTTSTPDG